MTIVGQEKPALAHYGVKGMKWGVRKQRESRKDFRARTKQERNDFRAKKAETIYKTAKKGGDDVLIKTRTAGDMYDTIATGKEFASMLERGGAFDVRVTEIYATKKKGNNPYVLNENPIGDYKKGKRG